MLHLLLSKQRYGNHQFQLWNPRWEKGWGSAGRKTCILNPNKYWTHLNLSLWRAKVSFPAGNPLPAWEERSHKWDDTFCYGWLWSMGYMGHLVPPTQVPPWVSKAVLIMCRGSGTFLSSQEASVQVFVPQVIRFEHEIWCLGEANEWLLRASAEGNLTGHKTAVLHNGCPFSYLFNLFWFGGYIQHCVEDMLCALASLRLKIRGPCYSSNGSQVSNMQHSGSRQQSSLVLSLFGPEPVGHVQFPAPHMISWYR